MASAAPLESTGMRRRSRPAADLHAAAKQMQKEAAAPAPPAPPPPPTSPTTPVGPPTYVEYVDVAPDPLDQVCQLIERRPSTLAVVVALPTSLIYLAIWSIMPAHWHRRHPTLSRRGPSACLAVVLLCVYWLVGEISDPVQLCCRRVAVARRRPPAEDRAALLAAA